MQEIDWIKIAVDIIFPIHDRFDMDINIVFLQVCGYCIALCY